MGGVPYVIQPRACLMLGTSLASQAQHSFLVCSYYWGAPFTAGLKHLEGAQRLLRVAGRCFPPGFCTDSVQLLHHNQNATTLCSQTPDEDMGRGLWQPVRPM